VKKKRSNVLLLIGSLRLAYLTVSMQAIKAFCNLSLQISQIAQICEED
jgi:hypothetical protein